ncbi:MAG: hypothetical protein GXP56_08740 [Deltaproteobacteria bacterium]|nr:hypothetical protein [Deltaproteobacteria bacterium]
MNSYAINSINKTQVKKARTCLKRIQTFPEIIGGFLFHKKKGILKNNMPGLLKEKDLEFLGNILTQSFSAGRSCYPDANKMVLIIYKKNIVLKMIGPDLALIIVCKTYPLSKQITDQLLYLTSNHKAQEL